MKFIIEFIKRFFFGSGKTELPTIIANDVINQPELVDEDVKSKVSEPVVEVKKPEPKKVIKKVKTKEPLTDEQKELVVSAKKFGFKKTNNTDDLHYMGATINVKTSIILYTNKNGNKITKMLRKPYDKSINKFLMRYVN